MGFVSVDVSPDQIIEWFGVYPEAERKRSAIGPCPHDCPHNLTATVGWGADLAHYELVRCDVRDGCNGNCRGWMGGTGASGYELHRRVEYKQLGDRG